MIKVIFFDFDGVLIESAHIKTEAFKKLFSRWPEHTEEIVEYHKLNMGISRYVKFQFFYENILRQPYTDQIGDLLSREFSNLVKDEILRAPLVAGTLDFLQYAKKRYQCFIASGTPETELKEIVEKKMLNSYFKGIFGSPDVKSDIVNRVMQAQGYQQHETVFIGDALSDKKAASETGVHFILRLTGENVDIANRERHVISDLTQLHEKLEVLAI